jgi:hypothetical protein
MMEEMMNANRAEMRSTVCAIRAELKETIQCVMRAAAEPIRAGFDETTACHEATETNTEKTEPDSRMMQSIAEHQVALKEDAVVKPVKGRKERHRGRKPAAELRGKPK